MRAYGWRCSKVEKWRSVNADVATLCRELAEEGVIRQTATAAAHFERSVGRAARIISRLSSGVE